MQYWKRDRNPRHPRRAFAFQAYNGELGPSKEWPTHNGRNELRRQFMWRRTGRSTWFLKGQAHLVESTPEIRKFVQEYPDGVFGWRSIELYGND